MRILSKNFLPNMQRAFFYTKTLSPFFAIFLILLLSGGKLNASPVLFYWKRDHKTENFGDSLSKLLIERIVKQKVFSTNSAQHKNKFLAIGSILHFAKDGDHVWGCGVNGKIPKSMHSFNHLHVYAVRGPLTRSFLLQRGIACPKVYGDPAILLPDLFPELTPTKEKPFIIIPNLNEIKEYQGFPNLVLPTQTPMKVINEILKAKFVISGSLHGIIIAEAFGIPARMLRITNHEHLFKYKDYYLSSGRKHFKPAKSIQEALELGGEPSPKYKKQELLDAFPYQLFQ